MNKLKSLLFILFLAAFFHSAHGQQDSLSYDLEEVIVRENRIELPFSKVSRSLEVLTREQIQALPAVSIAEVLNYVAGVDIRQRGVHGVQSDVSIRGGTFDQTLVLVNGIKINDPQTGHHLLNLPVDIENVERIEVLKGPGARIYGQNAFAGAINIVTRTPKEQFFKIGLQAGENQLGGVKASLSFPKSNFQQYFSFAKDFSQGYRYNTDYDINQFFYQSSFRFVDKELSLMAGYTEREFGANGFYASPEQKDQYETVQTSLVALQYRHQRGQWLIKPTLSWRRNQDEYIFIRSNPSIYRNLHIGNTLSFEFNAANFNRFGTTGMGLEAAYVSLASNNLGNHNRTVLSAFLEHRFSLFNARLDITPGVSVNYFSDFDVNAFPGIDVGLNLTDSWKLFANAGYTYRVPTFTDLYYEDPVNLGNPDLEPESAISYEGGIKYFSPRYRFQASYFMRAGRDLIDWTRTSDTLPWQPRNFSNLDMSGVDASFSFFMSRGSILRSVTLGYTLVEADVLENEYDFSRYALNHLRHQAILGMQLGVGKFSLDVQGRYYERIMLDDYLITDVKASWKTRAVTLFIDATNILDEDYTGANLVLMPGRWIRGGIDVTFR